jgi:hypothetical protein
MMSREWENTNYGKYRCLRLACVPLSLLVNGFSGDERAYAAYMESRQAVLDLLKDFGMARPHQLLNKLSNGTDLETAFAAACSQPFSRWAAQWRPLNIRE